MHSINTRKPDGSILRDVILSMMHDIFVAVVMYMTMNTVTASEIIVCEISLLSQLFA